MKKFITFAIAFVMAVTTLILSPSAHAAPQTVENGFAACPKFTQNAQPSTLGSHLGPGTSETLTDELRVVTNQGLTSIGRSPLPNDAAALRYLNNGRIVAVDSSGSVTMEISKPDLAPWAAKRQDQLMKTYPKNGIINEVKRIVGACLGFGGAGGMGFEQLVRWLSNPVTAAKFVIRRIGLVGAISCIGGIIWSYIG